MGEQRVNSVSPLVKPLHIGRVRAGSDLVACVGDGSRLAPPPFLARVRNRPNVRQGDRGIDANASCVTTNSGDLMMAGHHSDAMLLGLFQVSVLHNVVHLLFGVGVLLTRKRAAVKA